ncbi:aldehyde dehydrogenase family protein [Herbaspirillum seropedicae]|uniref:aldehyde dehydrogenase family protein n=1 Tax=Herbaspirillum seropedicae TaxID=964 RepID=UPI00286678A8|nr:aldehyde dehydrogenase family protein [Herbaspirillum seropedicae]MDR6397525.1 aldehyde dehydrogenase (NAD+) [Herbaspirillum seropedicae]
MNKPLSHIILERKTLLIGERWAAEGEHGTMEHINPSTGKILGKFASAGVSDLNAAVAAAKAAYPAWRAVTADQKREILLKLGALLERHRAELDMLSSMESGHPISLPSTGVAIDHVLYNAGWIDKLEGQTVPVYPQRALNLVEHEPYGVIGAIVTWNGPLAMTAMKVSAAIAAGNCVVLKPAELAPFAPARFAELALEAGLPPGVLNVVTGGPEVSDALVRHKDVGKITFTGSIPIARQILKAASETIKPVLLELGGKSANIVFPDADLDNAAHMSAFFGAMMVAGQGCLLPTRLLVHNSIYDEFVERVVTNIRQAKLGDALDPATMVGPVISSRAVERIMGYIDGAKNDGSAKLLTGGERGRGALADGYFIEPTVFGDVDNRSRLAQEEIFGPVLSVIRFDTEEQAIAMANDTSFGLAGYVHTNDLRRAHRVASQIEAGYLGVNAFPPMPASAPFGGWKESGVGKEGGRIGIEEFRRAKNIYIPLD